MQNKVAQSTYRIYHEYYLTSCFCFGAKVCLPPWITGINQKEWILTYSRLDGSQVELLFDLHHLSREIKFGGKEKKSASRTAFAYCTETRGPFMLDETLGKTFFLNHL